jgi:hypothetical protein
MRLTGTTSLSYILSSLMSQRCVVYLQTLETFMPLSLEKVSLNLGRCAT